ncbi:MAG: PKD domain-containing protein [Deinococcales bacterium]
MRIWFFVLWCLLQAAAAQTLQLPSTGIVGQSVTAVVTFSSSGVIAVDGIDWGDGSITPVTNGTNGTSKSFSHTYNSSGTFRVQLSCWRPKLGKRATPQKVWAQNQPDPNCPQAFALISISYPTPTLELSPNPAEPNQSVTAVLGNLSSALNYTLDWGDGSIQDFSNRTSAVATHSYSTPQVYSVRLTSGRNLTPPQVVALVVQRKNPVLQLSSSSVLIGETLSATLTQLYSDLSYTLEWGDGTQEVITGASSATRSKKYGVNATRTVRVSAAGVVPQLAVVVVRVPEPTLELSLEGNTGSVTASIGNIFPSVTYTLDWGDGSSSTISGQSSSKLKHSYAAGAKPVYVVKLGYPGGIVSASIPIGSSCQIQLTANSPGQPVKAEVSGLFANSAYQIDWGDGNSDTLNSNSSGNASTSHSYAVAKLYTVQVKIGGKTVCVGSVNVGDLAPTVIAQIKLVSPLDPALELNKIYPDETVNALLEPLTIGQEYTFDYGDSRPKLSFSANAKSRIVPLSYAQQKQYTLSLAQKGKTTYATLRVALPEATETIAATSEVRAGLPATFVLSSLLEQQNYELEFGDGSKSALEPSSDTSQASHTYQKPGEATLRLFWVGKKGTRAQRASLKVQVLEPFSAKVFSSTLYFEVNKNAVSEFDTFAYGAKPSKSASLSITYSGFGVLEGEVFTNNQKSASLSINLPKNGGEDAGAGKRRLKLPFNSFSGLTQIGDYSVKFVPQRLNGVAYQGSPSNSLKIFVHPTQFSMGGFNFQVEFAKGSLSSMNGSARLELVLLGKDFGTYKLEFADLKAQPALDPNADLASGKVFYLPGKATIEAGKISHILGKELTLLDGIRLRLEQLVFMPKSTDVTGRLRIPYPTCPIEASKVQGKTPSKELQPPSFTPPAFNKPYPPDKVASIYASQSFAAQNFSEAVSENLSLGQLSELGAVNFGLGATPQLGGQGRGSRLVRTAAQGAKPSVQNPSAKPRALYDYVVPLSKIQFDQAGGFYLENAKASIEGYHTGAEGLYKAPTFKASDSDFSLACSGVALPENTTLTLDFSKTKSPPASALLETYGGAEAPDVGAAWQGVLLPKAYNSLEFVNSASYGAKAAEQGISLKDPIPANISYQGGYNWSVSKAHVGSGVVNAWKFDIANFAMSMYHSKVVDGKGNGKFYLPFFVLEPRGKFFVGEVGYSVSPTWEIVTDEFIQKDLGASSVVAGCGVFAHESGAYPLKFASAFWAVKRLVKNPTNILAAQAPTWQHKWRRVKGGFLDNLEQHYRAMRNKGGTDTANPCNPDTPLKASIQNDAGLRVALAGLRVFPNGELDMNGQQWRSIGAPQLELAGLEFPASQFGIQKIGTERYDFVFKSDAYRLAPCSSNASDCLPAVKTELRYPIQNGKDLGKVVLKGFKLKSELNPESRFEQTFPDREIALSGKLYYLEHAPSEIWVDYKTTSLGNLAAASEDFCVETASGLCSGSSSLSGGVGNTMDLGGIQVTAQMFVQRKGGKTAWGVYAGALSDSPLVTAFGALNVYGLYGGIVYNKKWDTAGAYASLADDFSFGKLKDSSGLQVIAGAVFTLADGSSFHGAGVLFVDLNDNFAVTLNVAGWLLTPYLEGYLAKAQPHARALIQFSKSGLSADLCVGNTNTPPNTKIECAGLRPLRLAKILEVKGYAGLSVGSKNYVYIGTYKTPITVTVLPESSTWKTETKGYLMLGQVESALGPPIAKAAPEGTGLYVGFGIKRDIEVGDSGSVDLLVASCDWSWYAKAGWAVNADFVLTVAPFLLAAEFNASAYAGAGASGCGVGISVNISGNISGGIKITSSSADVTYTFSGSIATPSPLPDINFSKSGLLNLY